MPDSDRDQLIITTHPTQIDIERAKRENKLVVCAVTIPDEIMKGITKREMNAWANGFSQGLGIEASDYISLVRVPSSISIERGIEIYIEALYDAEKDLKGFFSSAGIKKGNCRLNDISI